MHCVLTNWRTAPHKTGFSSHYGYNDEDAVTEDFHEILQVWFSIVLEKWIRIFVYSISSIISSESRKLEEMEYIWESIFQF